MARVGPDTCSILNYWENWFYNTGGYQYSHDRILMFSHTHLVGSQYLFY